MIEVAFAVPLIEEGQVNDSKLVFSPLEHRVFRVDDGREGIIILGSWLKSVNLKDGRVIFSESVEVQEFDEEIVFTKENEEPEVVVPKNLVREAIKT